MNEENSKKLDLLHKIMARIDLYINATNTKSQFTLALFAVIISSTLLALPVTLSNIYSSINNPCWRVPVLIFSFILFASMLFFTLQGLFFAIRTVEPYLFSTADHKSEMNGKKSVFFFCDIASLASDEYSKNVSTLSQDEIFRDLANQVHTLAVGASIKFQVYSKIPRLLIDRVLPLFATIIILNAALSFMSVESKIAAAEKATVSSEPKQYCDRETQNTSTPAPIPQRGETISTTLDAQKVGQQPTPHSTPVEAKERGQ